VQKVMPCLWFDTAGEEAAKFYVSVFPNSRIVEVTATARPGRGRKGW
jgi:predicted 3-demethylubiquinone-9 3-methyltransferase (glyoxalase superfamily)